MRKIIVLTGPPGTGKSTIISRLVADYGFVFPVPHTSRRPRKNEVDGIHYHFKTEEWMVEHIKLKEFEIWTYMLANYYGYHKNDYEKAIKTGRDIVLYMSGSMAVQFKRQQVAKLVFLKPKTTDWALANVNVRGGSNDVDIVRREFHSENLYGYLPFFDIILSVEEGIEKMIKTLTQKLDLESPA